MICLDLSLSLSTSLDLFSSLPPSLPLSHLIHPTQVNLQAAKSNYERELAAKEEAAEEARRSLIKQLRDLEAQIDDERKQKSQALSAQKKTESELAEMESQIDAEAKGKEDALRMYKKTQVSMDDTFVYGVQLKYFEGGAMAACTCKGKCHGILEGNCIYILAPMILRGPRAPISPLNAT